MTLAHPLRRTGSALGLPGLAILFFLGAAPASAQLAQDVRPGATYQDWQVLCEDTPAGESCFITQAAADEDGEAIMQISIGFLEEERAMVIYLPLGLDLRPGILFQVGEGLQREFPYQVCLPSGCRVLARVDTELLDAMRNGTSFRIGVRTMESDRVGVIEGSLMGFTAGFQAISQAD